MGRLSNSFNEFSLLDGPERQDALQLFKNPVSAWPEDQLSQLAENNPTRLNKIENLWSNNMDRVERIQTGTLNPNLEKTYKNLDVIDGINQNDRLSAEQKESQVNYRVQTINNAKMPEDLKGIYRQYANGEIDREAAEQQINETFSTLRAEGLEKFERARNPEAPAQEQDLNNQNVDPNGLPVDPREGGATPEAATPVQQAPVPTINV